MTFTCADKPTARWLESIVPGTIPWEEASLGSKGGRSAQDFNLINTYLPNSVEDGNDKILKLIKGQNASLNTAEWRVLKRTQEGTATHFTMSVNDLSAEAFKKNSYKVSFKFGQVVIKPKSAGTKPPAERPPQPNAQAEKKAQGACKLIIKIATLKATKNHFTG